MDKKKLDELRNYYDNTSLTQEIAESTLDTEVVQTPMVGITIRLPAERLERVRALAAVEGVKTTALIRRWIEQHTEADQSPAASSTEPAARAAFIIANVFKRAPTVTGSGEISADDTLGDVRPLVAAS